MYIERTYRDYNQKDGLFPFTVKVEQTDLFVKASRPLVAEAEETIHRCRRDIEHYIAAHPDFIHSLVPLPEDPSAPEIVRTMLQAAVLARVGPMATIAGAIAEFVGQDLLQYSPEVMVENGGDIFLQLSRDVTVEIFAGPSPLSHRIGIRLKTSQMPAGICTSSKSVGPSLSMGNADAVSVLSQSTALADGMATAIGNNIKVPDDIEAGLQQARQIQGVEGAVIVVGDKIGAWGNIELVPLGGP